MLTPGAMFQERLEVSEPRRGSFVSFTNLSIELCICKIRYLWRLTVSFSGNVTLMTGVWQQKGFGWVVCFYDLAWIWALWTWEICLSAVYSGSLEG